MEKLTPFDEMTEEQLEIVKKFWRGDFDGLTGKDVREMLEAAK